MATASAFRSFSRLTGVALDLEFTRATDAEVDAAAERSFQAFLAYRNFNGERRATFLEAIATELEAAAPAITSRYVQETALPEARANGELARTCAQLRMFARVAREGKWLEARIDTAQPDRQPLPKPDMRAMRRPVGPVAVFGASNFALAFSVAGGDTASALAAGCPVIAKAHPAHPGVSHLVSEAIARAANATGMPEGTFQILFDDGITVGQHLVRHARIAAVGFTGSRQGGLALVEIARQRPVPIPVFAEMSSINPVFLFPSKLADAPAMLSGSITMGVGQFCTNPGLTIVVGATDEAFATFLNSLATNLEAVAPGKMLSDGIANAYATGVKALAEHPTVTAHSARQEPGAPALFSTTAEAFLNDHTLQSEVFGPCGQIVRATEVQAHQIALQLEGQLTSSFIGSINEIQEAMEIVNLMELKAGRLLFNQMPTGLEVCDSTVHGGPFPATSDGRSTSVGSLAIERWSRLVCWQNAPEFALPEPLR